MRAKNLFFAMFAVSGLAIACGSALPLPIPPVPVELSLTDLGRATLLGYKTYAGYAAAMIKLDSLGAKAVGQTAWRANSYHGYFTYMVGRGANTMYVEKGCNSKAIDNVTRDSGSLGGGGGGGGIGVGCGGAVAVDQIVGWTQSSQRWTVCTSGACTSGVYTEYTPVYNSVPRGSC